MRRSSALVLLTFTACSASDGASTTRPTSEVRPLVGTGGLGFTVGSIPPGPQVPFGLVRPGPDTSTNGGGAPEFSHCAGYWYEDTEVRGFSQLHAAGTGVPDYGVLMIMPAVDLPSGSVDEDDWRQQLDHRREVAEVGYYALELVPSGVEVELTATARTALYRLTYPAAGAASLVVDLAHGLNGTTHESSITIDAAAREVSGSMLHEGALASPGRYWVHFVMRFDRSFTKSEVYEGATRREGTSISGGATGAILSFGTGPAPVHVQLGVSFVDLDGARANLDAEWAGFDLDATREKARAAWDDVLRVVDVEGGEPARRQRFYTALYHAQLMPTLFTDATGRYRGLDEAVHDAAGFTYFTDFSLWDTFRTMHPLMVLLYPDRQRDFDRSLERMTIESGRIPKWPLATIETDTMIAHHGETVMIDSFVKGVGGFDPDAMFERLRAAAKIELDSPRKRDCFETYDALGYCAADRGGGSASRTLENAFSDFALSQLAERLDRSDDATFFRARSSSWKNLINTEGMIQGRNADGSFPPDFRPDLFSDEFTEGNSRQWTTFVPQDVPGFAAHLGGTKALDFLIELFTESERAEKTIFPDLWYWHGNEPDIHAAYMAAELGRSDLTEAWVRWILDARYALLPAGLDGNDDGGTLSAWYVFSALGLYPKVAEDRYVLGAPLFPKVTLHLANGKAFTIRADGWTKDAKHVARATLNGRRLDVPFVTHADVVAGGELVFEVSETPVDGAY